MPRTDKILNLAVMAHVDAGKTTLTEGLLYLSGAISAQGRVDDGTSVSDSMSVEKSRGISVRLSSTGFSWKNTRINIIDTPGHADFSAEVERALAAADCALLIVCASQGVQAQTRVIWNALRAKKIPTMVFVNKLDRVGANSARVIDQLSNELKGAFIPLQIGKDEGSKDASLSTSWRESSPTVPENHEEKKLADTILETVAQSDDELLEEYLENDTLPFHRVESVLKSETEKANLYPVFLGVASTGTGIEDLLDGIVRYLPTASGEDDAPLRAMVYKVSNEGGARSLAVRVFEGTIKPRDLVDIPRAGLAEKVSEMAVSSGSKTQRVTSLGAGESGFLKGLASALPGDLLGNGKTETTAQLGVPLMTVRPLPVNEADLGNLASALSTLHIEDPALNFKWLKDTREMHLDVRGRIQIEILTSVLQERFNLQVEFGEPSVIYKETPISQGEAFERYWMPKPCWAIVRFSIEPLTSGSGVVFESKVSEDKVARRYQREIERHLPVALAQGPRGWEVTDLKVTLLEGEDHQIHTRPGDFAIATSMAMMTGLTDLGTRFLEPVMAFSLDAPEDALAQVSTDLRNMRAINLPPNFDGGFFSMAGEVPASTSMDYPALFASRTGGKGRFMVEFDGYRPCPEGCGESRSYRGVNPLDRSKFILHARKAFG